MWARFLYEHNNSAVETAAFGDEYYFNTFVIVYD